LLKSCLVAEKNVFSAISLDVDTGWRKEYSTKRLLKKSQNVVFTTC
jgi:hypothetical protein